MAKIRPKGFEPPYPAWIALSAGAGPISIRRKDDRLEH